MKKNMINTLLLSMAVALMGCSESDKYTYYEGNAAPDATITTTQETLAFTEVGGTVTFNVTTTAKEWGVYATESFIKVDYENTNTPSGAVTVWSRRTPRRMSVQDR